MMEKAPFYPEIAGGPAHGTAYWIHADDKVRLRVGLWRTEKATKGTIFLFPGRTEYIEKYGRTVAEFDKSGYATFVVDWRGQGLADRVANDPMVSHVVRFSDYYKDVAAMIKAAEDLDLPKPWYLIGHSMGACIGLRAVMEGLPVAACAFTAPLWGIDLSPIERCAAWPLSWTAQAIGMGQAYAPGNKAQEGQCYVLSVGFQGNRLTNDSDMFEYMVNQANMLPDMQIGAPSMGWLFQALKETRHLSKMSSPDIPCIAFCGDHDVIVDVPAIQDRMGHWPNGRFELIQNAKHEILSEIPVVRGSVTAKICELFS